MKYLYHLFLIIFILLMAACRTSTRFSETDKKVTQDSSLTDSRSITHQYMGLDYHYLEEMDTDSSFVLVDMTWWSYPDSTGKQHPQKSANIKYQSNKHKGHKARDSLQCSGKKSLTTTSQQEHHESAAIRETKDEKIKPPDYGVRSILLTLLGLGILIVVLKKI